MPRSDFPAIYEQLRNVLQRSAVGLKIAHDLPGDFHLVTPGDTPRRQEIFFGAVKIQKNFVSYYLMPIYLYPDLLEGISSSLLRHLKGKSCFRFTRMDRHLVDELSMLTQRGMRRFQQEGWA
jgi:hypothetical protein